MSNLLDIAALTRPHRLPGASALSTVKNSVSGTVARSVFVQAACISSAIVPIVDRVAAGFVCARIRSRALIGCARSAQLRTIAVTKTGVHVLDHSDVELAGSAMSLLRLGLAAWSSLTRSCRTLCANVD